MKKQNKKNLLVTLADKNYIEQAKQLFSSVYWNAGWKGDYMLLSYKIPEKELKWFRKKGILIKKCNLSLDLMSRRWPSVILSKLYLFTPEFKKWKQVVFLDGDIIVRSSLDSLIKIKGLAAAKGHEKILDLCHKPMYIRLEKRDLSRLKELKRKYNTSVEEFNVGVLAFNTSIIKKDMFDKLKKLTKEYVGICASIEELALNLLFYKQWKKLPRAYNVYPDFLREHYNIKARNARGIILHFVLDKPWEKQDPFYKEWKNNLDKAEQINIKKPQKRKSWTKQEILNYEKYLEKRKKIFFYKKPIWELKQRVDRFMGLVGIFLRRNHPNLYYKLKKQK